MAYESPIKIEMAKAVHDIIENENRYIMREVYKITGIEVNKNELEKALRYDRGQYELGFLDGQIEAEKHDKWTPCIERLPHGDNRWLVTLEKNHSIKVAILRFAHGEWQWDGWQDDVIAWMPLPEPYKEDANE